ncbi:tRNA pseudouridine synthase A [Buchnera aphidicola (Pterocallis alni)]|uniref:tRNA pseudouridine(38-40) synthase TruA n=1 Tax=Buchnera aphidicola TaxID=9 RepID=UPI003463D577
MNTKHNMIKFALGIEYDGSNYHGWQIQKGNISSIQKEVEKAISIVANHKITIICAGRTDSKVHSIGQVVHFSTISIRKKISWILGINNYLPNNISVQWIKQVSEKFHARYSALSRCYRYIIYNNSFRSALYFNQLNQIHNALNIKNMLQAAKLIVGEYDFSSFRSKSCQSSTPYRKIIYVNISYISKFIFIDIQANSFLQCMVRNIVGCLIEIGKMKRRPEWILYVLKKKNRHFCAPTASPSGLYLLSVYYPNYFRIPYYTVY